MNAEHNQIYFIKTKQKNIQENTQNAAAAAVATTGVGSGGDAKGRKQLYDFPKLTTIISQLQYEFDRYKYTVYRCAAKFVTLQKMFFTSNIPYRLVLAVMDRHGIREADVNLMVPPFQLTSLIHDVYYACEKLGHFTGVSAYSLESATAVLSNFFWNIFDPHRRHSISLLEIKLIFLLLCKLYASDQMISEFYSLCCNPKTKCVSKLNFEYLLNIMAKLFSYIGEGAAYGAQNIPLVVDQCFARCHNLSGLTDYQFHCLWSTTQTRFLIYANLIALIKRIEDTEKLIHMNICASCRMDKITGIRFKCQSCKDLSLCMRCFATGFSNSKHNGSHRMYEVFTEDLPSKTVSHYLAKLCTVFLCSTKKSQSHEEEAKGFANETQTQNDTELITIATTNRSSNASTVSMKTSSKAAATTKLSATEHVGINGQQQQEQNCMQLALNTLVQEQQNQNNLQKIDSSLACLTTTATNALNVSEKLQTIIDKLLSQNRKLEAQLKAVKTSSPDEISEFLNNHQQFLIEIIKEMRNIPQNSDMTSLYPTSSTPNRSAFISKTSGLEDNFSAVVNTHTTPSPPHALQSNILPKDNLTHSINGADINRSYLDANKSDYSINDVSVWFNQRRLSSSSSVSAAAPFSLTYPTLSQLQQYQQQQPLAILTEVPSQDNLNSFENDNVLLRTNRETEMSHFKLLLSKVKEIVEDSYSDNTELSEATQNLENVLDSIIKTEEVRRKSLN